MNFVSCKTESRIKCLSMSCNSGDIDIAWCDLSNICLVSWILFKWVRRKQLLSIGCGQRIFDCYSENLQSIFLSLCLYFVCLVATYLWQQDDPHYSVLAQLFTKSCLRWEANVIASLMIIWFRVDYYTIFLIFVFIWWINCQFSGSV